ncbi:hypothetical protein QE152_g37284 [Popillia japonica]|uniref:Uncharacterized protein n=1 Tax=Popillia japonica TaxID=7064 RepID=A0AAW1IAL7_POPJA
MKHIIQTKPSTSERAKETSPSADLGQPGNQYHPLRGGRANGTYATSAKSFHHRKREKKQHNTHGEQRTLPIMAKRKRKENIPTEGANKKKIKEAGKIPHPAAH